MSMKENQTSHLLGGVPASLLTMASALVMVSSADLRAAVGMSIVVLVSTLLASITICALRRVIPKGIQLPANLLIITGFVSLVNMLMQAHFPVAVNLLGVHLAALAASPVMFEVPDSAVAHSEALTIRTALLTALFLSAVMLVCALIREPLGSATIWGRPIAFLESVKVPILSGAYGGYLVMALLMAVINALTAAKKHEKERSAA